MISLHLPMVSFDKHMAHLRHRAMMSVRGYFNNLNFIELETPSLLLVNTPDPHIDPIYVTTHGGGQASYQLHTSPEIWLKRGLALGLDDIYHIARVYRDDPLDQTHSKEFTMIEWYRTGASLADLIIDCRQIFDLTAQALGAPKRFHWVNISLNELFARLAHLDLRAVLSKIAQGELDSLQKILAERGDIIPKNASFSEAFSHVMSKYIEPGLDQDQPVIVHSWPTQMAALAQLIPGDNLFCDRFEIYFCGREIANAYQECNDPDELLERFRRENLERSALNKQIIKPDVEFLNDLKKLKKTAGIALGFDRLLMSVGKKDHIKEVQFGT